jgi:polysaccharide deacetylase family protein (PEP-CTERM system associated)
MHCFSVDVEDYFQVEAFARVVPRARWPEFPLRVIDNTKRLLSLLERYEARGTFFVLGWVAERCPSLVAEIRAAGHEIGCHSYWHRRIYTIDPAEFREDTRRAKAAIEDAAGCEVRAYRAPTFSITRRSLWALDVLAECGFTHDSSIFPVYHDHYGIAGAPRHAYALVLEDGRQIVEYPPSTIRIAGATLAVAGGGYLRMLPLWFNRAGIDHIAADGHAAMVYVHPWEIDPSQPRIAAGLKSRLRHYARLSEMEGTIEELLRRYRFVTLTEALAGMSLPAYSIAQPRSAFVPVSA